MDKKLKETITIVKKLQRKELLYMNDSIGVEVEPNYQVVAAILESLNLIMDKEFYDCINDEEELIYELAISNFKDDNFISEIDIELIKYVIKQYVDTKDPVLINNIYAFTVKMDKLENLYKRALNQIEEGKFKNYIF
ncbi:hypothetical protein [Clostridium sporogenes]|uniref:hypothetical protein n=1 Tax=Clostridium sporogenes TaxID=1509 RepID=UPI00024BA025|nr:hypothetical protein [Clostridium sporogenes]EHN13409.1 hypothetical protein IYC_17940 [Clostridium sporogenes PA 3679]MDU4598312.1 hypothetical protein [Clostridium sporogenes]NFQ33542.1 hypothetical protein [Clostridium sporogenes]NFQ61186.1 hypothetical protein [Clostridium sporogenes]NFU09091.1 hypothetical protein [Clostridium sporogenes]